MRTWLIRRLGGITKGDAEAFRVRCRDFAEKYLSAAGMTLYTDAKPNAPGGQAVVRKSDGPVVVIGDYVAVWADADAVVHVAPWSRRWSVVRSGGGSP